MTDPKLAALEVLVDVTEKRKEYLKKNKEESTYDLVLKFCPLAKRAVLDVGDIAYKHVAIELKGWSDFINAFTSKSDDRFRRQLYNFLINSDIEAYYIIHGDWHEINEYSQVKMTAVLGAIASIQARYGMRLSVVPRKDYAVYMALKIIEKTLTHKDVRPVTYKVGSDERAIDGLVAIGERVGSEDGIRLLEHFGSFKNVVNATKKQMIEVNKIGDIKADNMLKVINYDFKSKSKFDETIDEDFDIVEANNNKDDLIDIDSNKVDNKVGNKVDNKVVNNDKFSAELNELKDWSDDIGKNKGIIYRIMLKLSKTTKKSISMKELLDATNIEKIELKVILNDLILESRIYQSDEGLYDVY